MQTFNLFSYFDFHLFKLNSRTMQSTIVCICFVFDQGFCFYSLCENVELDLISTAILFV